VFPPVKVTDPSFNRNKKQQEAGDPPDHLGQGRGPSEVALRVLAFIQFWYAWR